jgi:hypothetical protein
MLFQTYVSVAPDGRSARARVDEIGLRGQPPVSSQWTQGIYENSFVRENGEWRIRSLRYYPRLITDYSKGWGADAQPAPGPVAAFPADGPPSQLYGVYPEFHVPAFHFAHPVTGRAPQYPDDGLIDTGADAFILAGPAAAGANPAVDPAGLSSALAEAETRARRALAYDAVENLVDAYAFYLDECGTELATALFAPDVDIRFADGTVARDVDGIRNALQRAYCPADRREGDFTLHHALQPVIDVADDGRSATFSARLWEVHASNETADTYRGGMLEGEAILEAGRWKLTALGTRYLWTSPAMPDPD